MKQHSRGLVPDAERHKLWCRFVPPFDARRLPALNGVADRDHLRLHAFEGSHEL